jgi:hypothetical protein
LQHIEAALDVEEASLSQIHRTVGKQISRLQLEERMLKILHERLVEEAGLARAAATEPVQPSLEEGEEEEEEEEDREDAENDNAKLKKRSNKAATGRGRGGGKAGANAAGHRILRDKGRPSPKKRQK